MLKGIKALLFLLSMTLTHAFGDQIGTHSITGGDEFAYQEDGVLHMLVGSSEQKGSEQVWVLRHYTQKGDEMQTLKKIDYFYQAQSYQNEYLSRIDGKIAIQASDIKVPETEILDTVLWRAENEWNAQWEDRYQEWIADEVNRDIFLNHEISTDCANVGFFLRWIFAREHRLPIASTMAGSGAAITNHTMRVAWRNLPTAENWHDDQRFRAVLDFVADNTFTGTLRVDSYPIKINQEALTPGSYYLRAPVTGGIGHLVFIHQFDHERSVVTSLESTLPSRVRRLSVRNINFAGPYSESLSIRRHRWAIENNGRITLRAARQHQSYSMEQFAENFTRQGRNHHLEVLYRLNFHFTDAMITSWYRGMIARSLSERVDVVFDGRQFCLENNCEPGSSNYNSWSTPVRDARIISQIDDYLDFCFDSETCMRDHNSWYANWHRVTIRQGNVNFYITVDFFYQAYQNQELSSDPRDRVSHRWGIIQDL